jgi:hypothetical protein
MQHLWVVEMWEKGQWRPTVGASLTRLEAHDDLADWRDQNPNDQFRIRKYVRTS